MRNDEDGVAHWVLPEYVNMSLRPGIGADWLNKFRTDVFPSGVIPVPGKGVMRKVPRYYEKMILESDEPEIVEALKKAQKEFVRLHGDDFTPERLEAKYRCRKAELQQRTRGL